MAVCFIEITLQKKFTLSAEPFLSLMPQNQYFVLLKIQYC